MEFIRILCIILCNIKTLAFPGVGATDGCIEVLHRSRDEAIGTASTCICSNSSLLLCRRTMIRSSSYSKGFPLRMPGGGDMISLPGRLPGTFRTGTIASFTVGSACISGKYDSFANGRL